MAENTVDRWYPKVLTPRLQLDPGRVDRALRRAFDMLYKLGDSDDVLATGTSVSLNGTDVGTQPNFNFIEGDNLVVNLTVAEDTVDGEIDITVDTPNIDIDNDFPYNTNVGNLSQTTEGTGFSNTTLGYGNLRTVTSGYGNVAIGTDIMSTINNGFTNIGIGYGTLLSATTSCFSNVCVGSACCEDLTSGFGNVAIGHECLINITTDSSCVAIGYRSSQNVKSSSNVGVGTSSLQFTSTGGSNTAVGTSAGSANTTGTKNSYFGASTTCSAGTFTNSTALGYAASVNASNKVRVGDANVTVIEGQVDWTFISDREAKENFKALDPEDILTRLTAIPVTSWNYIGHDAAEFRHIGPMAQDIHAAFGMDEGKKIGSETSISSSMLSSLCILGIQGLVARLDNMQKQLDKLSK